MDPSTARDSRPVKIRMLLSDAVRICRGSPGDYFGMAALVALAPMALTLLSMARDPEDLMSPRNVLPGMLQLGLLVITVIYVVYMLGAYPVLAARALGGRPAAWTEAFSWLRERHLLSGVLLVVVLQMLAALGGLILLVVPGIILAVLFMLVIPARVLGDHRGLAALSESRRIVGPVLFKGGLSFAGVLFIPWALLIAVQGMLAGLYGLASTAPARVIPATAASYLVTVLWSPIDGVAHALFYIERAGGVSKTKPVVSVARDKA